MEEKKSEKEAKNKKKKKLVVGLVVVLAAVIAGLGITVYVLLHKPEEPKPERTVSEGLVVDGGIDEKASNARFTTDMNMVWTFPSGSAVSNNAIIGNSASNEYECYFEVYLDNEEQTMLYSSPVLPVGKRLDELKLNQVLPDGTYDAICDFHILDDVDPEKELGIVSFAVSLMFIRQTGGAQ